MQIYAVLKKYSYFSVAKKYKNNDHKIMEKPQVCYIPTLF